MKLFEPSTWPNWFSVLVLITVFAAVGALAAGLLHAVFPGARGPVYGAVAGVVLAYFLIAFVHADDFLRWVAGTVLPWLRDNVLGRIR